MSDELLGRGDTPFGSEVWNFIDQTILSIASQNLSARKLLHTEGPYGIDVKFVPGRDKEIDGESGENLTVSAAASAALALLVTKFSIGARDIEQYTKSGIAFDTSEIVSSALAITAKENKIIFEGSKPLGIHGLLNTPGAQKSKLKPWSKIGDAVESIIEAIDKLDSSGFHGPYSLALSSPLYNSLFKRYPQEEVLEIEHLKSLITGGIIKASSLKNTGVLVNSGSRYASIVLGQDLTAGFEGPSGRDFTFVLSESVSLRVVVPEAICVME
ncbi:MAG: bacteriocin family protein [Chitinispirillales bacterium]|nr:bacteriocin family protein [Chitinispirillales bacterium]